MQRIAQSLKKILFSIILCVLPVALYAEAKESRLQQAGIHFDQSQEVYFEQFSPSNFLVRMLKLK